MIERNSNRRFRSNLVCPGPSARCAVALLWLTFSFLAASVLGRTQDQVELARPATWQLRSPAEIRSSVQEWMKTAGLSPDNLAAALKHVQSFPDPVLENSPLDFVIQTILFVQPQLRPLIGLSNSSTEEFTEHTRTLLALAANDSFVRNHVDLQVMKWLVHQRLYDEALEQGKHLQPNDVLDPVSLLYCRAIASHQLADKQRCLQAVRQLLEHKERLPRRVVSLSQMMLADLEPLSEDSLDEISRLMNDVQRRQSLHRAGQKVRDQEDEILRKLDRLIERAEQARQQMAQQPSGGVPSSPMQDSQNAAGLGSGDVTKKNLGDGGSWGNLPPSERAAALAELTRDMPPHYRTVIEEYFRRLAQEEKQDK